MAWWRALAVSVLVVSGARAQEAAPTACAALEAAWPLLGRTGTGANPFRPLPVLSPVRSGAGAGTLDLSLFMTRISTARAPAARVAWVGNYRVTNLPVLRVVPGAATQAWVGDPVTGAALPIPASCLATAGWIYGGTAWALRQGDRIDALFTSRLDYGPAPVALPRNGAVGCRASNLHTHGLLVSPYRPSRPGLGPYGDYVLDVTAPADAHDGDGDSDDCGTALDGEGGRDDDPGEAHGQTKRPLHYVTDIPGSPGVNSLASGQHPSGLFWYHPHPHGFSRVQASGGTTGAITVGELGDYACPAGAGVPGACDTRGLTVRILALKDTQILKLPGGGWSADAAPDNEPHGFDPEFCAPTGPGRRGECDAMDGSGKWVFTINGVQYPVIRAAAGRTEVWRLVNASPNVTYRLRISPEFAAGPNLPFQVLARDGVSARPAADAGLARDVLLMPGTRVEIAVPAPAAGGRYVLRQDAVTMGANGGGDTWPAVDLAVVAFPAGAPAAPLVVAGPAEPQAGAARRAPATAVADACHVGPEDRRVVWFVHRVNRLGNEVFGLMAGIRRAGGGIDIYDDRDPGRVLHDVRQAWREGLALRDAAFPGFMHNPFASICTVQGAQESWELVNWTSENHNFHIHQSRFTIDPAGPFVYPRAQAGDDPTLRATDALISRFADREGTLRHDVVPVPRGQSFCRQDPSLPGCRAEGEDDSLECTGEPGAARCARPGRMTVRMDFSRDEQVGTFVYHCHILEHEDGGMMARVTVMCPVGDAACAARQAARAICRAKP